MRARSWKVVPTLVLITLAAAAPAGHASAGVPTRSGSISINFDDAPQVCNWYDSEALHDRYAPMGVRFRGPAPHDGGGIGSEPCGNWRVKGYSPPNFLAFNVNGTYRDGGHPVDPETIVFLSPVSHVQVNAAHGGFVRRGLLTIMAYSSNWTLLDADELQLTTTLTTVDVDAPGITYVVLHSRAWGWVLDDLEAS